MSRAASEIRVVGEVAPRLLEDFGSVTMSADPVGTTMRADFADAAELHGFLGALRRGGHILVDVRREQVYEPLDSAGSDEDSPGGRMGEALA